LLARLEARIETNRGKDREDLKEMREEIKSGHAEMRSTVCAMRSELEETVQHEMRALIQPIRSKLDETTACNKATETKLDPVHKGASGDPKGESAMILVGEPRKRRRVCNLAAERRQKRKERTRGYRGSGRKLAAACKRASRRAKVAWRKRNLFRRTGTQEICGSRKRVTITGRMTIRRAKLAWRSEMSSGRTGPGTRQNEEPRTDEKTGKVYGKVRNGAMAQEAAVLRNRYI
jgi:hypothetical protein